jgi:Ca2+-binding EF-hand superfamily protein
MQIANFAQDEIEETFARLDKDGDRSIDIEEFMALMLELDRYTSPTEMRARFDAIDQDRDGRVTFDEFRAWCR